MFAILLSLGEIKCLVFKMRDKRVFLIGVMTVFKF